MSLPEVQKKKLKLLKICGCDTQSYSQVKYDTFYLRKPILELIKFNRPVIVTGFIEFNPYDNYYTFRDIKPFAPNCENIKQLCGHVNIPKKLIDPYINLYDGYNYSNELFVLVCKAYRYFDKDNEVRGSLTPTEELHISPIMLYEEAVEAIRPINVDKYLNWYSYRNGYYVNFTSEAPSIKKQKRHDKYIRRCQKRKDKINLPFLNSAAKSINAPISLDYWFLNI